MKKSGSVILNQLAVLLAATFPVIAWGASSTPNPKSPLIQELFFERPQAPASAPKVSGTNLKISLREAVTLALARNFDILIEAHNPRIRDKEVTIQKSNFDPAFVSSANSQKSNLDSASRLTTSTGQVITSEQKVSAGLEKKFITGADVSLTFETAREYSNSTSRTENPNYESSLTFTLKQPLLKNFGVDVNKANISIASFTLDQSLLTYRGRVTAVIDSVEQAYWDLVFSNANLKFRSTSLKLAKDLLRRNRIQVEVGTLAPIEILEAEATVAQREEEVIVADRQLQDREDALKKILNVSDNITSWALRVTPTDQADYKPIKINEMASTMKALERRADLESARLEIEKNKVRLKRDRQNLMPELDLSASAGNQGVRNTFSNSTGRQFKNKGYTLSGELGFRIPIGNREARADLDKSRLELQRANATYQQLEQTIIEEIRRGMRLVRSNRKRITATRLASRLAEERLDSQEKKFRVGLSTSRNILEDQESVANALSNKVQALVDYKKSVAQLSRSTNTTLQRFKIKLGDPRKGTPGNKP